MPYLYIPTIKIGPIPLQPFGIVAVLAILIGVKIMNHRTKKLGLNIKLMDSLIPWFVLGVILGGHIVSAVFYYPDIILKKPLIILKFWDGISSYGGIFGGILVAYIFFRRAKIKPKPYINVFVLAAVFSLLTGRIGCSIVHDHPGKMTDFPLAVKGWPIDNSERGFGFYTDGEQRHDLGFYEFLFMIPVAGIIYAFRNYRPSGYFLAVLAIFLYTPVRFLLDFLRVKEKLYFGLTPGQYFSLATFILGIYLAINVLRESAGPFDSKATKNE
jgi:phosphatidylglycerol:prolipoprotein diacylglycerol transferase